MIEPAKLDPDVPTIAWAGKQWPVPLFGPDCLQKVWTKLPKVMQAVFDTTRGKNFDERVFNLTEDEVAMLFDVVYVGLWAAHRELTREEYDAVPQTPGEALTALFVIRPQSLMYGREDKKKEAPKGEAQAAGNQTGNASSPAPAATSAEPGNIGGDI